MIALIAVALASCTVTDGDTIRCGDEPIRLLAIDAPELPGHCARGRNCVEDDPFASSSPLQAAMQGRELTLEREGTDWYGRTLGVVYADGVNLSCL
jgi:endonuclease YncB( thermonuclease family)